MTRNGIEASGRDVKQARSRSDESPVGEADAPNIQGISNPPTSFPTLLPCPFCHQSGPTKVGYWPDLNGQNHRVRCVCGAVMAAGVTEEDAIEAWNTRPQLQSTEAVERYREALVEIEHAEHVEIARRIARTVLSKQDKDENSG